MLFWGGGSTMSNILALSLPMPSTHTHSSSMYTVFYLLTPPPHLTASPSCQTSCRELSTSLLLCDNNKVVTEIHFKAYLCLTFVYRVLRHPALYHCPPSYLSLCARAAYLPFANWTLPVLQAGLAAQQSFQYPCSPNQRSVTRRANQVPSLFR